MRKQSWIDSLTEEQKRSAGLLPEQQKARFIRNLEAIRRDAPDCRERRELEGALKAAITRLS